VGEGGTTTSMEGCAGRQARTHRHLGRQAKRWTVTITYPEAAQHPWYVPVIIVVAVVVVLLMLLLWCSGI